MKILIFTLLFFSISVAQMNKQSLMPYPKSIEVTESKFRVTENFSLQYLLQGERLAKMSNRFLDRLAKRTGLFLKFPFANQLEPTTKPDMFIDVQRVGKVEMGEDESYKISITKDDVSISAETDIGVLRAIETLLQLISADEKGYYFPVVEIVDSPRFPWRGLLIDVCRHYMPMDVLKRNIDGMASVKMNVLHWHLSEDQGFRVESKIFPKLTELGSDGLFYTHEQVREIIKYAADRGIRVIPEFDVPGHATAILTAYPELASVPGPYEIERDWGIFDPSLNPIIDETYDFLDKLFGEMSELFPDEYFHIGGDENNGKQWDANEDIQKFMKANNLADNHALQGYFNNKVLKILTKYGKKMVGWDEIFHPSMPTNIVIQSWRGKESLVDAAKKGYQVILSNGYYIDLIQPTDFHYLNDPLPKDLELSEIEKKFILGGEATMWSEMISPETIDSRIWPRTAAIAERLWSQQNVNNVDDMYVRLENISFQLEEHGLTHIKNYEMMLRRLTNNNEMTSLKNLISVIEPVKIYNRYRLRKQTQQTPLTRVIDAATADAKVAREFRSLVDSYLSDQEPNMRKYSAIAEQLVSWKINHKELLKVVEKSPILLEIKPMSKNLKELSEVGLQLLSVHIGNTELTSDLLMNSKNVIKTSKEPIAQTELMIVSAIEKLFNSISK